MFSINGPSSHDTTVYNESRKRKRSSAEGILISPTHQNPPVAHSVSFPLLSMNLLLSCLEARLSTLQTETFLQSRFQASETYVGSNESFISLAQNVVEQLILQSEASSDSWASIYGGGILTSSQCSTPFEDPLRHTLPSLFPQCEPCTFNAYIATGKCSPEVPSTTKVAARIPPRKQDAMKGCQVVEDSSTSIFPIPAPNMLVQRGESLMEISAAALPFWQELGLGPCAGPKDIRAICCFPDGQQMRRSGVTFLEAIRSTYQSLKLGSLEIYDSVYGPVKGGQFPFSLKGSAVEENIQCLKEMYEEAGKLNSLLAIYVNQIIALSGNFIE